MRQSDLPAIDEIYNQAIDAKFSTAHTVPLSGEERLAWFREHDPASFPVYVHESGRPEQGPYYTSDPDPSASSVGHPQKQTDQLAGWISFSPYRKGRKALQRTAEISYYVHSDYHRRGIATLLMEHAIQSAHGLEFKTLIAILMEPNTASIALLNKFGFELWGDMPGILEVEGEWYNHQYYGLHVF